MLKGAGAGCPVWCKARVQSKQTKQRFSLVSCKVQRFGVLCGCLVVLNKQGLSAGCMVLSKDKVVRVYI